MNQLAQPTEEAYFLMQNTESKAKADERHCGKKYFHRIVLYTKAGQSIFFCVLVRGPISIKLLNEMSIAIKRGITFILTF